MTEDIIAHVGIYGAAIVIGMISSAVPIGGAEAFVATVVIAWTRDPWLVVLIGVLVAFGQIAAKVPMYYGARGATRLANPAPDGKLARVKRWVERWKNSPILLTMVSAITGVPPFYLLPLFAGMLELSLEMLLVVGFIGRVIRFVAIGLIALYAT
jgi:membrane protein YqaA with SNARE-associated domain|nr:hypothetical protein [Kofleriaceae bacterium]